MNPDKFREDTAGRIHRENYGCSDKVNATCNQGREFQEGYRIGANSMAYRAEPVLEEERALRAEVGDDLGAGWAEFQRGFWAARCQCILFVSRRRQRKFDKFFGEHSDTIIL
jgi:hypothetical protein